MLLDGLSPSLSFQKLNLKSSMSLLPALRINLRLAIRDIQTTKIKLPGPLTVVSIFTFYCIVQFNGFVFFHE